ncbi:hypothetical protein [Endozoicomonas sp. ISHI1]|uniref:hypothetical protein n=3 Tax=Endozoicomonas TaxID=305899 RepID=UPI0021478B62|nr:hypothetical protein [Endozoicomonas sp. ISHI1]
MKQTRHIDMSPEVPENTSATVIATVTAGGDDGDKPPDGNRWNPDPEPQSDLTLVLSPVQKCLQQKRQLLRMLRIKRLWAIITDRTTLARILSDRIMVIEADILDLERSAPDTMHPGLVQTWPTEHSQKLIAYREITAGKYSVRQVGTKKKSQPSRILKVSTTVTTDQTGQSGQTNRTTAREQASGSTDGSGRKDDDPLKPSAGQGGESSAVNCSRCNKTLNTQELSRIHNEAAASAFLCNRCLSGTVGKKRARQNHKETEPGLSEPSQKKKKGSGRKRNHSKVAFSEAPAKKKKLADTLIPDDPLEKVKANIHYELNKEELEKAQALMEVFKKKNITVKYTFYKLLGFVTRKSFNGFFDNAVVFFGHLPETIKNTGMLTSMLKNEKKHIRDFAERSQNELKYLAALDVLTSLSSMNNGKGVPRHKEVKTVLGWPEWRDRDGRFNVELFRSFSSMYNTKGVPKHEEVKAVLGWPEWKDKDGKFSIEMFRSFSSMNHTKGKLKHEEVKEVLGWPEWRDKDGEFNMELLRSFSSMNSGKGMLNHEDVKKVLGWPEWKVRNGEFSMDLFRSFSSMNHTKGMIKHEQVKELLGWPEWQNKDGEFSVDLFRVFSSVNSSKGMLKREEVREVLSWPEWRDKDGEFNMELFRSFSSMNSGKGMLNHEDVKEVLGWPEWKDKDNEFNILLFRAFSSMNSGRGTLKHDDVKEVLGWPEWKDKDGKFGMELFRAFSSMNSSKGMPKHEEVKEVLSWLEWKDKDGEFNIELFRAFSSMNNCRGLLKHEEVKTVLNWPEWKNNDGDFSMELLRCFSSMNNSKGTPRHIEVKEMMGWPEWKDKDGEFSIERFRSFSSMNHNKGILRHERVKEVLGWPEWQDEDGEFNMERFRAFSSMMNSSKGKLKHEVVKEVLGWPEWKNKNGEFNMKLFRAFSSINNGQGVLKYKQVKEVLSWPEWKDEDGKFSMERFRAFSSVNHGRGLPKHETVKKVMGWTRCGGASSDLLLEIITRLWKSEGLPATEVLQQQETQLKQWLFTEFTENDSDLEDEEDDKYNLQTKTVALYLSTSKPDWSLNWAALKQFHQLLEKTQAVPMLESLIKLLSSYGGKGIEHYLRANRQDRDFLWRYSGKAVPLHLLNKSMILFSSNELRARFVYFVKRLKSLPDKSLWDQYSARLQPLSGVLKHDYMKRLYWEILQPLTKEDQLRFLDASHAEAVFNLFPSLSALHKLGKEHSSQSLKRLLEACLGLKTHDITKEGIQILFEALLKTHSFLPRDHDIPDHFLSGMHTTSNNTVEIPVSGLISSGEQLALSCIAVLMQNLNEMSFTVKGQWLRVEVLGGGVLTYRFPMPQLKIQDEKMEISNWSKEQFRIFLKIIRTPQHYYLTAEQWQRRLKPDDLVHTHGRETRLVANREPGAKGALEAAPFKPLPVYVLATLINKEMAIKSFVWRSIDQYKERLPESLLGKLRERIEASGTECPEEIKESLSQYLDNVQSGRAGAYGPFSEPETQSISATGDKREKQAFHSLWLKLNQTEVFGTEILTLLDEYGDEMELMHTVTVLKKAKIDTANHILERWRQRACSEIKRSISRDPLLSDISPDVYQSCQELELLDGCESTF